MLRESPAASKGHYSTCGAKRKLFSPCSSRACLWAVHAVSAQNSAARPDDNTRGGKHASICRGRSLLTGGECNQPHSPRPSQAPMLLAALKLHAAPTQPAPHAPTPMKAAAMPGSTHLQMHLLYNHPQRERLLLISAPSRSLFGGTPFKEPGSRPCGCPPLHAVLGLRWSSSCRSTLEFEKLATTGSATGATRG